MAIRTLVTHGYGNGTFNGTIALIVTHGYTFPIVGTVNLNLPIRLIDFVLGERDTTLTLNSKRQIDLPLGNRDVDLILYSGREIEFTPPGP